MKYLQSVISCNTILLSRWCMYKKGAKYCLNHKRCISHVALLSICVDSVWKYRKCLLIGWLQLLHNNRCVYRLAATSQLAGMLRHRSRYAVYQLPGLFRLAGMLQHRSCYTVSATRNVLRLAGMLRHRSRYTVYQLPGTYWLAGMLRHRSRYSMCQLPRA